MAKRKKNEFAVSEPTYEPIAKQADANGWNMAEIQEAVADGLEEADMLLFAQAEQLANRNVRVLRQMARLSREHYRNKRALAIFSFEWGLSAGNMARAVARHKGWFSEEFNATSQQLRILFILAQADSALDQKLYEYWQDHQTLQPWEVQRMVSIAKKQGRKPRPKHIKLKAQAVRVNTKDHIPSVELSGERDALSDIVEGANYRVDLAPAAAVA